MKHWLKHLKSSVREPGEYRDRTILTFFLLERKAETEKRKNFSRGVGATTLIATPTILSHSIAIYIVLYLFTYPVFVTHYNPL